MDYWSGRSIQSDIILEEHVNIIYDIHYCDVCHVHSHTIILITGTTYPLYANNFSTMELTDCQAVYELGDIKFCH